MYFQLLKSFLVLANIFSIIDGFGNICLHMSSASEDYLRSLSLKQRSIPSHFQLRNHKMTDQEKVEIDTIMFNIYKVDNIFFSKKSKTIMLRLKDEMKDIFMYENNDVMKLSNHTRIVSKGLRNFVVCPLDLEADAILYKDQMT